MAQDIFSDINPTTTGGTALASTLNAFKAAVASGFIGPARPANLQDGGYWIDDSDGDIMIYYWFIDGQDVPVYSYVISTGILEISSLPTGIFTADGLVAMTGNMNMGHHSIQNISTLALETLPSGPNPGSSIAIDTDLAGSPHISVGNTFGEVKVGADATGGFYIKLNTVFATILGGIFSIGPSPTAVNNNFRITATGKVQTAQTVSAPTDIANKQYVDTEIAAVGGGGGGGGSGFFPGLSYAFDADTDFSVAVLPGAIKFDSSSSLTVTSITVSADSTDASISDFWGAVGTGAILVISNALRDKFLIYRMITGAGFNGAFGSWQLYVDTLASNNVAVFSAGEALSIQFLPGTYETAPTYAPRPAVVIYNSGTLNCGTTEAFHLELSADTGVTFLNFEDGGTIRVTMANSSAAPITITFPSMYTPAGFATSVPAGETVFYTFSKIANTIYASSIGSLTV